MIRQERFTGQARYSFGRQALSSTLRKHGAEPCASLQDWPGCVNVPFLYWVESVHHSSEGEGSFKMYVLCWPKNVVKGCVNCVFDHATFDHGFLACRVEVNFTQL